MRKLTFLFGFALGYVLGSRAGRERYDAIVRAARRVMENPAVQGAAGVLQEQANELVDGARSRVTAHLGGPPTPYPNGQRTGSLH
jgi:hypothetical protein